MFEDRTTEQIKKEALAEINPATGLSSMAGSFADAVIGPAAQRVSELYKALPAVLSMLFVDETSGRFLDLVGRDYHNLTRREGTRAKCSMDLTGKAGTVVPAGTIFLTATGLRFQTLSTITIGTDGRAVCQLEAMEVGAAYNILPGTISGMWVNISGLTSYTNQEATGGTDRESGEQLYERIEEARQRPRTSGNGWDFRSWALEVDGVGEAKVVELYDGPGTVSLTLVDSTQLEVDGDTSTARLLQAGMEVDLGAVAKGFAAEEAEEALRAAGVERATIDLGGNVTVIGTRPDGDPWRVAVKDPRNTDGYLCILELEDVTLSTSGGYERYFEEDGVRYHHIIDPKTGYPADSGLLSVTVVTANHVLADALSTALFVAGPEEALDFWRSRDDFELVLCTDDDRIIVTQGLEDAFQLYDQDGGYTYEIARR